MLTSLTRLTLGILLTAIVFRSQSQPSNTDSLMDALTILPNDTSKVNLINQLAFDYHLSQPQMCYDLAWKALEISSALDFEKGSAKGHSNLAVYYLMTDQYEKAKESLLKAKELYVKIGSKGGEANVLSHLGILYQLQSDYNRALEYYLQALEVGQNHPTDDRLASIYGNLGNLYELLNDQKTALEYYQKASEIFEKNNNERHMAGIYGNMGLLYQHIKNYDAAMTHFKRAIELDRALGNEVALADNYANLGNLLRIQKEYETSYEAYSRAMDLDQKLDQTAGLAEDLKGISRLYLAIALDSTIDPSTLSMTKDLGTNRAILHQALESGIQSQNIYKKIETSEYQIYEVLRDVSAALGDYQSALDYSDQYWNLRNEVHNSEKSRELARLESLYEKQKSDQQIALLESEAETDRVILISTITGLSLSLLALGFFLKQLRVKRRANKELLRLNNELKIANDEKKKFFSIVAHDLINPIGGLATSLEIFTKEYPTLDEKERLDFITAFRDSSSKAYRLLENLLQWGRLQKNQIPFNPDKGDLGELIKENIDLYSINAERKSIKLTHQHNGEMSAVFDRHMLNSVVANLLSNAIKFTPKGGEVKVGAFKSADLLTLTVSDNGVGMNKEKMDSLFKKEVHVSTLGTANEQGTGLGLLMCKEFVEMHGGKLKAESTPQKGSKFEITIPISE